MRLGQTSLVFFLSRVGASFLGFIATIYFARLLGAEPLGIYYHVLAVVSWLAIAGNVGVSGAIIKRVSEGEERGQYALAGTVLIATLFGVVSLGIFAFKPFVNTYVGYPVASYIVLILFFLLTQSIIISLLSGVHLVHIRGLLSPTRIGARTILQVAFVVTGMGVTGLFIGYAGGYALVALLGSVFVFRQLEGFSLPERRHFRRLIDYAKFSWLGSLKSRMFNYTDVLVLGFFVSSSLIGVYSIAWNIAKFLILFAGAISNTFFPEISKLSADREPQAVAGLVEDTLSYAGLLLIPGLVGGVLLGERILRIYGDEFPQGAEILVILILANLVMGYQNQILNTLNAIDRPDLSFRVNAQFVVANLLLNIILVYRYGWVGAAVATALSVTVSLVLGYHYLNSILDLTVPYAEIARQWIAALLMGGVVYGGLWIENTYRLLAHNFATVLVLVGIGAGVYFLALLAISVQFRRTVSDNLPVEVPLLTRGV